jgi:AcrR family transcriptional regulator
MAAAGVSTTAFYARFDSKEGSWSPRRACSAALQRCPGVLDQARDLESGIARGVDLLCDRFETRKAPSHDPVGGRLAPAAVERAGVRTACSPGSPAPRRNRRPQADRDHRPEALRGRRRRSDQVVRCVWNDRYPILRAQPSRRPRDLAANGDPMRRTSIVVLRRRVRRHRGHRHDDRERGGRYGETPPTRSARASAGTDRGTRGIASRLELVTAHVGHSTVSPRPLVEFFVDGALIPSRSRATTFADAAGSSMSIRITDRGRVIAMDWRYFPNAA